MNNINSSKIPNTPINQLNPELQEKLTNGYPPFIDIHTHIFNYKDIPDYYLGFRLPISRRFLGFVGFFLHNLIFWTKKDYLSRAAYLIKVLKKKNSSDIFDSMKKTYYSEYDNSILFGVLTMDMLKGIDGTQDTRTLRDQLFLISKLAKKNNNIISFAAIDPTRNAEALRIFEEVFSINDNDSDLNYVGLKVYPSLGYLPTHPILMKMFEVCEAKQIPVLSHCSSALTRNSNDSIKNIPGIFINDISLEGEVPKDFKTGGSHKQCEKDYRDYFNRPHHWLKVLETFPNLRLNLAHFGGNKAWEDFIDKNESIDIQTIPENKKKPWVATIIYLLKKYPNVYADFSYTFVEEKFSIRLKELMLNDTELTNKILFGSDYSMVVIEGDYKKKLNNFKSIMQPNLINQMARNNNLKYLFNL